MYDKNNIFARIIRKEINTEILFENEYVLAFNDIAPVAPIHVLIIPKGDFINFSDFISNASNELLSGYFSSVVKVAEAIGIKDYRIVSNNGEVSGQSVFHFHLHMLSGTAMESIL